jgi:hypothetical protein
MGDSYKMCARINGMAIITLLEMNKPHHKDYEKVREQDRGGMARVSHFP